jgi:hypothetical protein
MFFYAKFNLSVFFHLAKQFRDILYFCNKSKRLESGALNWVIVLSFKDNMEWIFRSPRKYYNISPEIIIRLFKSKIIIIKYIKLNNLIFILKVFDYRYDH